MNGDYLFAAMGGISPIFVEEAEKQPFSRPLWRRALPLAAGLAAVLGLSLAVPAVLYGGVPLPQVGVTAPVAETPAPPGPVPGGTPAEALRTFVQTWPWIGLGCLVLGLAVLSLILFARGSRRLRTFAVVLWIQTGLFLPCVLYALTWGRDSGTDGRTLGLFYCGAILSIAILLLIAYLQKTEKSRLSFAVPLAAAVYPAVQELLTGLSSRLDGFMDAFYLIYYTPVLVMSLCAVGWYRFQTRQRDPGKPFRVPRLLETLAVVLLAGLAMAAALSGPDIHLEKGEYLMLEAEAPMLFAIAFGVVTLLFALFLLSVYRKRKDRSGLWCFILQWAMTLLAFRFLMTALTLRPGDAPSMYTETVSGAVGLAGVSWAVSILFLVLGLKEILDLKKGDSHESD